MIDWTFAAIAFVAGGLVVHLAHEWIWRSTARRVHREVMGAIAKSEGSTAG